jgi:hypothetical protein
MDSKKTGEAGQCAEEAELREEEAKKYIEEAAYQSEEAM